MPVDEDKLRALVAAIQNGPVKPVDMIGMAVDSGVSTSLLLRAYNGHLSAAHELHTSMLPNHHWSATDLGANVYPKPDYDFPIGEDLEHDFDANGNPPRAWLLAILSALIQENKTFHADLLTEGEG